LNTVPCADINSYLLSPTIYSEQEGKTKENNDDFFEISCHDGSVELQLTFLGFLLCWLQRYVWPRTKSRIKNQSK
jgi:hypothetical protein